jgi:hypothetical protein
MILARVLIALFLFSHFQASSADGQSRSDARKLYDGDARVREDAAERLVAKGQEAIPYLLPVLCQRSKPHFDEAWPVAAKALARLKAAEASRCLVPLLLSGFAYVGITQSDEKIEEMDPAFAALVQIGDPAVPAIRDRLPMLPFAKSYLALRALRAIGTPAAKSAIHDYISALQRQISLANEMLQQFDDKH